MKRFFVGAMLAMVASGLTWAAAVAGPNSSPATKADCGCGVCKCPDCNGETCTCDNCECTDCGCGK